MVIAATTSRRQQLRQENGPGSQKKAGCSIVPVKILSICF